MLGHYLSFAFLLHSVLTLCACLQQTTVQIGFHLIQINEQSVHHNSTGGFKTTKTFYEYVLTPSSNSPGLTVKNTEASKSPTENMSPLLLRWIWGDNQRSHIISSQGIYCKVSSMALKSRFCKSQVKTNAKGRCCCSVLIHTESLSFFWSQGLTFITPNPNVFYKFEE